MAIAGTLEHPKTRRLARQLGQPPYAALGLMEALWHWARKSARTGRIDRDQWEDAADSIGFTESADKLRELLIKVGFIDAMRGWDWVHDWHKYADEATRKALQRDGKQFANGAPPRQKSTNPQQNHNNPISGCPDKPPECPDTNYPCPDKTSVCPATPEPVPEPVPVPGEEERGRARAGAPDLEVPPPPPPPKASEARGFIERHVGEILARYPGDGSRDGTTVAAVRAFERQTEWPDVENWWGQVMEAISSFDSLVRNGRIKRVKDLPFWFDDDWHRKFMPVQPLAAPGEHFKLVPMAVVGAIGGGAEERPEAPRPRLVPKSAGVCQTCAGMGEVQVAELPPLSFDRVEELADLLDSAWQPCPDCAGSTGKVGAA